MYRFVSILLALTLVLVGCSSKDGNSGNEAKSQASAPTKAESPKVETNKEDVKLQLAIWGDDGRKKMMEDIVKGYTDQNPHVSVEILLIPFDQFQQKMSIMLASRTAPDVTWLAERMIPQFASSGQLVDISAIKSDADYDFGDLFDSSMDIYKDGSKLYGVPFTNPPKVLFFNKTLFKEKGLTDPIELAKAGQWNYEKFEETAKALTDKSQGIYGMHLFSVNGWKNWQDALIDTIWSYGADIFNADQNKFVLNSPEGEQVMQFLMDNIQSGVHPSPGDQITFETGKLGMSRQNFSYVNNARKIADFEWDIAPMPKGPADAPVGIGLAGYSVMEGTDHPEESMALLKYLTSKETMTKLAGTFAPNRRSVLSSDAFINSGSSPSADGIQAALIDPMNAGVRLQVSHENWQQIDVKIQTTMEYLYAGNTSVKDVLKKMEEEVAPLVK